MKKKCKATVTCPTCEGTGQKELSTELANTLAKFGAKSLLTTADLLEPGITANAMSNRLESLRSSNLLDRRRKGRFWNYFKTEAAGGKVVLPPDPIAETSTPDRKPAKKKK